MKHDVDPKQLIARLKRAGMTIEQSEIGKRVSADDREFIKILGGTSPPSVIDKLYDKFDGFSVTWRGKLEGRAAQGAINILPFNRSASRPPLKEDGKPLQGILWTDDTPAAQRKQLTKMTIFETVPGRSQFITYLVGDERARLFFVDRDDLAEIVPDFATTLSLIFRYAGAEGLRGLLVHKDWEARVVADPMLQHIAGLA